MGGWELVGWRGRGGGQKKRKRSALQQLWRLYYVPLNGAETLCNIVECREVAHKWATNIEERSVCWRPHTRSQNTRTHTYTDTEPSVVSGWPSYTMRCDSIWIVMKTGQITGQMTTPPYKGWLWPCLWPIREGCDKDLHAYLTIWLISQRSRNDGH